MYPSIGSCHHVLFSWLSRNAKPWMALRIKEIQPQNPESLEALTHLWFSSSFYFSPVPKLQYFVFFTLKTQPCTIQSSKSLLLQPQLKIVYPKPHFPSHICPFSKMGKGLLRYARWISSFTKLDNNKSNNNNNNDNNLKSNIFCLCSILLIHINRGIFTPRVQVYTFRR